MALFESLASTINDPVEPKQYMKTQFTNINFNLKNVFVELNNTGNSNSATKEKDMCDLIYNSFSVIFDDVYLRNETNREAIIYIFGDPLFLNCLIKVLPSININNNQRICCNKIAWDYLSTQGKENNNYMMISKLLFQLSYITNRGLINILSTHMPIETAKYVALARFSSFNESKNIKRVNNVLIMNRITVQDIVNIYSVLFVSSITPVFESIMFNFNRDLLGVEKETDGNMVLAILIILENMPTFHIKKVLKSYTINYELLKKTVRFPIRAISSGDYKRILNVVGILEEECVYVP